MNVVLAVVVLYASLDALARHRPRRWSSEAGITAAPRRWLRLALRAIGSTAVAAAVAIGFSDGASAEAVDTTAVTEAVVVSDNAADPPVTPSEAPPASADPPSSGTSDPAGSTTSDTPPNATPSADSTTTPAPDPVTPTTDPAPATAPASDPVAGAPATTPAAGDATPATTTPPVDDDPPPAAAAAPATLATPSGDTADTAPAPVDAPTGPAPAGDPVADAATTAAAPATDVPAPPVAPTTWAIDLRGAATISSDGTTITIHHADPSIPDVRRPVASVRDIVVTGSDGADSLTVLGSLGAALRYDGGAGDDALTLPGGGSTVRLTGSRQGDVFDGGGSLALSYSGVDDLVDGPGADTYVAWGAADLARLILGAADRLRVDARGGASGGVLSVDEIHLNGTLDVTEVAAQTTTRFLNYLRAFGDFTSFRGLDRGRGNYLKPVSGPSGYDLDAAKLPDEVAVSFQTTDASDDFFGFLSGKSDGPQAGTTVAIDVADHTITGDLTVGGTADAATLDLTDAVVIYGDPAAPLYTLTGDSGTLLLTPTRLSGRVTGAVTTSAPGVRFDGTFESNIDSDAGTVTTTGTDVTLTVGDVTFTGIDLTLTGTRDANGPVVWVTGSRGATASFARGLLAATLTGELQLALTASGATLDAPVTLTPTAAGVPAPSGAFQLRVDASGAARLDSPAASLATSAGVITGAMTLREGITGSAEHVVVAQLVAGTLSPLAGLVQLFAIDGTFLLSSRGVVGAASGTATFAAAGLVSGTSPVNLELNDTGVSISESVIFDGISRAVQARGPPAGGAPTFDLRGPEAVFTAGALTLTVANPGLLGAPVGAAPWLVDLSGPAGRVVAVTADGADLVLSVDGVSARRRAADVPSLVITGSDGNDVLRIDAVLATAVTFAGGAGRDVVRGPAVDLTWTITGAGTGTVAGVAFSGVEDLVGAAGNQDVFAFTATGELAGLVAGGDGGYDTMRFDGGSVGAVSYLPSGIDSGRVLVGARTFDFVGLEPVDVTGAPDNVTVTFGRTDDVITLSTTATGQLLLDAQFAEDFLFAKPSGSLTINVGGGELRIGTVALGTANLTVNAASTLRVNGALSGGTIVLNVLRTGVVADSASIIASGDLTIAVSAGVEMQWAAATPFFRDIEAAGRLDIGDATLSGVNVTLTVDTTTKKFGQFELDELRIDQFLASLTPAMAEGTMVTFVDGGAGVADTIVRDAGSGSWLDDGFTPDLAIRVTNSTSNNGFYRITGVTQTTLTLAIAEQLTAEVGDSEVVIEAVVLPAGDPALTFGASIVTRNTGNWILDGFEKGQTVRVVGTPDGDGDGTGDNDGEYALLEVTATTLRVDAGPGFVPQGAVTGVQLWAQGNPALLPIAVVDENVALREDVVGLQFTDNGATGDTITRLDGRDWTADGFAVGMIAIVDGPTANRGSYRIAALAGTVLTIDDPGAVINETIASGVELVAIAAFVGDLSSTEVPTLTFNGTTITRSSGNWADEGFAAGQSIQIDETTSNNGTYRIANVNGTVLTIVGGTFTAENTAGAETDPEVVAVVSLTHPELTFQGSTITRATGNWQTDGFAVGDRITIDGATVNGGQFRVTQLTATTMTVELDPANPFTTELAWDVTINRLRPYAEVNPQDDPSNPDPQPTTVGSVADTLLGVLASTGIANLAAFVAQVVLQDPTSDLNIATGADIRATGALTVAARTTSQLKLKTESLWIGATYGRSDASARVNVASGVLLHADGDISITADVTNGMKVGTVVKMGLNPKAMFVQHRLTGKAGLIPGPALTAAVGEGTSLSTTTIAAGAVIEGANVVIRAENANDFQVSSKSGIKGLRVANTGLAAAVVVSNVNSDAIATVGGTIRATGNLTITGRSVNAFNYSDARAKMKAEPYPGIGGGKAKSMAGTLKSMNLSTTSQPSAISAAGAVTVATSTNDADAIVSAGARLSVLGSLSVVGYAEDNFKSIAIASAKLESKPDTGGSIAVVSLAGAVAISSYHNEATSRIGDGAIVNVGDALTVKADAVIPNQITIDDLFFQLIAGPTFTPPPSPSTGGSDPLAAAGSVVTAAGDYLSWAANNATGGLAYLTGVVRPLAQVSKWIPNLIATTNVGAVAGGKKTVKDAAGQKQEADRTALAISGTVIVMTVANLADASIGVGALVNEDELSDPQLPVTPTATQRVDVLASTSMELLDFAGITKPQDLKTFITGGGTTGKVGVGGTYQGLTLTAGARAAIEDGARVSAATDVVVKAFNRALLIVLTQQGGNATLVGISGAFSLLDDTTRAQATIEDTASVIAGRDLVVDAGNDMLAVTVSGVMQKGGRVSIGVGIAINSFDTTTQAVVRDITPATGTVPPTSLQAGRDITVNAKAASQLYAIGIAGAQPSAPKDANATKANPTATTGQQSSTGAAMGNGAAGPVYGFGLSAEVSVNFLKDLTEAVIRVPASVIAGRDITVTATTTSFEVAVAGSVIFSKVGGLTLAGAFAWNELSGQTFNGPTTDGARRITRAELTAPVVTARNVVVHAVTDDRPITVTAGLGLAVPKKSEGGQAPVAINLAGSATVAQHRSLTEAVIGDDTNVTATGDVTVLAERKLRIVSVTGAIVIKGTAAVGAAVEVQIVDDVVQAAIGAGANVTAGGTVRVSMASDVSIVSVAAALALLAQELAVPISVNIQVLTTTGGASIGAGATVEAAKHLVLDATTATTVVAVAGSGAFLGSNVGIGLAVGVVQVTRAIAATVGVGAELMQGSTLGAGDPSVTVRGAEVRGVVVHAEAIDDITLAVAAGSAGRQPVAVTLSPAVVIMNSSVSSKIDQAAISGTTVAITARSVPHLYSLAIAGSVAANSGQSGGGGGGPPPAGSTKIQRAGFALAGAAAGAINLVDSSAEVIVTGSSITATAGSITIRAVDDADITSDAGGVAIALAKSQGQTTQATFGIGFAITEVTSAARVSVTSSDVTASVDVIIEADSSPSIDSLAVAGALAAGSGGGQTGSVISLSGAGAGARNTIRNTVAAIVTDSTLDAGRGVRVSALDNSVIGTDAGGFAISLARSSSGSFTSIAVGLSVALNDVANVVAATVDGTTITARGILPTTTESVVVEAISTASIRALTMAGSGGSGAGAGAGSGNNVANQVTATVIDSTIDPPGDVRIEARDTTTIDADAGGVAVALSLPGNQDPSAVSLGAAIGITASINNIANDTRAIVDSSSITAVGDIAVLATSRSRIDALTLSGTAAVQKMSGGGRFGLTFSGAGTGSGNAIDNLVEAVVTNGSHLTGRAVSVVASMPQDAGGVPMIRAQAYGVAFALTVGSSSTAATVDIGVAVAKNDIGGGRGNIVRAIVERSIIEASTTVDVDASVTADIDAIAVGVAVALTIPQNSSGSASATVSLAGGIVINAIHNTVLATVRDGAAVTAVGAVRVHAGNTSSISADAGAGALSGTIGKGGSVAIAAAVSLNQLSSTVDAEIDGASTTVSGASVEVSAVTGGTITTIAVGVSVGFTAGSNATAISISGGVAVSTNTIRDTVRAGIGGAAVNSDGDVAVTAGATANVEATVVAVAVSVTVSGNSVGVSGAVAAAVATNDIGARAEALITDGARITAGGAVTVAATLDGGIAAGVGAGSIGGSIGSSGANVSLTIAAAVATNTIHDVVLAQVSGPTTTIVAGALSITAASTPSISSTTVAVAVGFSVSSSGVAVSLTGAGSSSTNTITDDVRAIVDGARATAPGGITVAARSGSAGADRVIEATTVSAAVNVAVSANGVSVGVAVAVSLADNRLANTVVASVSGSADLCAGSRNGVGICTAGTAPVSVTASDAGTVRAAVGAGSLAVGVGSGGSVAIGVALAENTVEGTTQATVSGGSRVVGTAVTISAAVDTTADALSVAVGISVQATSSGAAVALTGTGAESSNTVRSTVSAGIAGATTVVTATAGDVDVTATERSTLIADAGAGSLAVAAASAGVSVAGAVGVGLASNTLDSRVSATVDGGTVTASGAVDVVATSDRRDTTRVRMSAIAVGVAVSVAIANPESGIGIGLSGAGTDIDNLATSVVSAAIRGGANVTGSTVHVTATDTTTATATSVGISVAVAVGVAFAVGAALATTNLSVTVAAVIDGATVASTTGNIEVRATSVKDADAVTFVLAIAAGIGGAGAGANAESIVGGATTARIGAGALVFSAAALVVNATTEARSHARSDGGAGSVVAIAVMLAKATTSVTTSATRSARASPSPAP